MTTDRRSAEFWTARALAARRPNRSSRPRPLLAKPTHQGRKPLQVARQIRSLQAVKDLIAHRDKRPRDIVLAEADLPMRIQLIDYRARRNQPVHGQRNLPCLKSQHPFKRHPQFDERQGPCPRIARRRRLIQRLRHDFPRERFVRLPRQRGGVDVLSRDQIESPPVTPFDLLRDRAQPAKGKASNSRIDVNDWMLGGK